MSVLSISLSGTGVRPPNFTSGMQLFRGFDRMVSMKWTKRIHHDGAVYHAMAHSVNGGDLFTHDEDRATFSKRLLGLARDSGAEILAYCLLRDRFHIAIRVGAIPLGAIMRRLLTSYATGFNARQGRKGHLFQARYKATIFRAEEHLAGLLRHIHLLPVHAGLAVRAGDWPWSSFVGRQLSDEDAADDEGFEPWPGLESRNLVQRHDQMNIGEIGENISARTGIAVLELRSKSCRRPIIAAKRLLAQEAVRHGHSLKDISRWMNSSPASLTRYARHQSEIGRTGTNLPRQSEIERTDTI